MAVLGRIRNNAAMLVIVIAVALGAFIIGDGLKSFGTLLQMNKNVALEIDGEKIPIQDFQARVQTQEDQLKGRRQQLSDEDRVQLSNQIIQSYISEYALGQLAEEVGVSVTPEEVYNFISGTGVSASPMARQFFAQFGVDVQNTEAVNEIVQQMNEYPSLPADQQAQLSSAYKQWTLLGENIKTNRLQTKLMSLLSRSYKLTDLDAELAAATSRQVAYVSSAAALVSDSTTTATEDEIQKYYDEHKDFFRSPSASAEVNLISIQVTPSADDYQAYANEVDTLYQNLLTTNGRASVDLLRNYSEKFTSKSYLTVAELDQMGIGADEVEFIKTKAVGDVYKSPLVNDRYNVLKLVAKKNGVASVGLRVMMLDSAMSVKADSLVAVLDKGADFSEMAKQYSQDPQTAQDGGLIQFPNRMGEMEDSFSEYQLTQMGLDTIYNAKLGSVITLDRGPYKMLIKAENPKPEVEKYQILYTSIPVVFSEKTYSDKYNALNAILGSNDSFDKKMEEAAKSGFRVVKKVNVATNLPQLSGIPSSHPIITWAMEAEDGEIANKLYRCGTDYLAIAQVVKHNEKGFAPLTLVRESIKARVEADKRAEKMVKELETAKLTTLDAYASKLETKVDTLVAVNYDVRGMQGAEFNAMAMTTPLGQVSKPFASNQQVLIVQPIKEEAAKTKELKAQTKQKEAAYNNIRGCVALWHCLFLIRKLP